MLLVTHSGFGAVSVSARDLPDPLSEIERLTSIWGNWESKVTSLDVDGYQFVGAIRQGDRPLGRDELVSLFRDDLPKVVQLNSKLDIHVLESVTAPLFNDADTETSVHSSVGRWGHVTVLRDANNSRLDISVGGHARSTARRGTNEQTYSSGAQQASVYTAHGPLEIPTADMFVFRPVTGIKNATWSISSVDSNTFRLTGLVEGQAMLSFEYDVVSGFVSSYLATLGANRYVTERFQSQPVLSIEGIPVARTICELRYQVPSEFPSSVISYVLDTVHFDSQIDEARFNLAVPAGTRIVEFSGADGTHVPPSSDGTTPRMMTTKVAVSDAEAFVTSPDFIAQEARRRSVSGKQFEPQRHPWRIWLVLANAMILATLGYSLFRSRRK